MKIRTLKDGEKIMEPGFYKIPLSVHHSQPCDGPSVTSGVLRKMELQTPADVWASSKLNPNRWEIRETDALRLGAAMAAVVEGGKDELLRRFKVHDDPKPRRPSAVQIAAYDAGTATEAGKLSVEYWRKVDNDPDTVDGEAYGWLTPAEVETLLTMGTVLSDDPAAHAVMGGVPEITMAYQDDRTGIWVLSRPDTVSFDGSVSDYKKINTQGRTFNHWTIDRRIEQHGYHQQMALAVEGFERLTGETPSIVGIVAQWDQPPHHVILREIGEEAINIGRFHNRRALDRFHECLISGHWPGPGDDIGAFQPSDGWWKRAIDDMNLAGVAP